MSFDVKEKVDIRMPAFMYGTELSTVGHQCVIPGFSYNKFYEIWGCPKIVMEVAVSIGLRYSMLRFFLTRGRLEI